MATGLIADSIYKHFGGVTVLDGISLEIKPGEVHSLIGPNGAGKSTLANIVSGYVRADAGSVTLNGQHLDRMKPSQRARSGLGRTFQNLELFGELSVVENVAMGFYRRGGQSLISGLVRGPRVRKLYKRDRADSLEILERLGLAGVANVEAASLPYGAAKIVELARLIALGASVVVLDEPAAGLPLESARAMEARIREIADGGVGVLLIEHNMALVMSLSDRVSVLHHGKSLASGTPAHVQADEAVIEAYLGRGKAGRV